MKNLLMVFAKSPIKGEVKTRLGNEIGFEKSHWVYLQLLKKTAEIKEFLPMIIFFLEVPLLIITPVPIYTLSSIITLPLHFTPGAKVTKSPILESCST